LLILKKKPSDAWGMPNGETMNDRLRFDGKTAVITGAASGMGRAMAVAFAGAGANVVLADVAADAGQLAVEQISKAGGTAIFQKTDVSIEDEVASLARSALEAFGSLDIWVNNAATLGKSKLIGDQQAETLERVLGVNVKGTVFGMQHALSVMTKKQRGVIVNVSSVQGFRVAYPGMAFYAASKAAVVSLTKSAALEYGALGIRVVGIAPGPIDTPMLRSTAGADWPPAIVKVTPLARVGEPEEVADATLWLCSDEASYITGATLPVDGGFLAP
jgi:NAD(P)-dependent dehydrogenase (short-subunit alcohol dehydrogenase family)